MCVLAHTYRVCKASDLYLPEFPTDCDTENYPLWVMRQGTGEGGLGRDRNQFKEGSVEQRGKETNWGGGGGWRKEDKSRGKHAWGGGGRRSTSSALLVQTEKLCRNALSLVSHQTAASGLQRPPCRCAAVCSCTCPDAPVHPGLHVGDGQITLITAALPGWAPGSVCSHLNNLAEVYWSIVQLYASCLILTVSLLMIDFKEYRLHTCRKC